MSVHLSFECMIGTVYTDNGDRGITAAQSSKQPKVQWILRDEDFNVVDFGRETPSEFVPSTYGADFSHNCTGKLADCSFFINSEDFTIENLKKDENYQVVKGKPKEGDFGIYYDPKTGKVQHVESFVMSEGKLMINTKGGAEQTEYSPESERGKDADFKKGNKYQIIRKIE